MIKVTGKIKWYNKEKGYGFIEIKQDVFFTKDNLQNYIPSENDDIEFLLYDKKLIDSVEKYIHRKE